MSNTLHKRSISGTNSNISSLIKVNRQIPVKDKNPRNCLTPTRNTTQTSNNQHNYVNNYPTTSRVEYINTHINPDKMNKIPPSDRQNKNNLFKSYINMPIITANKNISESKKSITSRTTTTSHLLKSYREEKLKPKTLDKDNSFESHNGIKVRRQYKSPIPSFSKSPLKVKNTKNESLLKRYEELKNRSISPITIGKGVIKIGESKVSVGVSKITDKENKFTSNANFKEMNTSPLVLRV
jgi:hypothetical protein